MEALLLGAALGLSAGLSPGPLLALVLREAVRKGARAGMLAATAPLLSDSWVVALAWWAGGALPAAALGALQLLGGLYLLRLGYAGLRPAPAAPAEPAPAAESLRAAVVMNLTNPHMYLFWFLVGAPLLHRLGAGAWGFLLGFYLTIVGSKAVLAWLAARMHRSTVQHALVRLGDLALLGLGLYLIATAWISRGST
ncbi:LysE family transporter [Oceanithermus profundus]|uniref:Lysine exporter protein (LYSE/YGGA) n=1 Tax=Oceanithermus profundus (strain DSM 14977 / NBRC 100410 / VKM B-2274 / 506) TaxID=670487 RepID=E4U6P2_OCEP5|nr:LysE family transporter [Oceanithermus profundus]ADR35780.1 Lysine exporter protein (LYSE/YGGA) [Oceanithermus profundus DSM 14977]